MTEIKEIIETNVNKYIMYQCDTVKVVKRCISLIAICQKTKKTRIIKFSAQEVKERIKSKENREKKEIVKNTE